MTMPQPFNAFADFDLSKMLKDLKMPTVDVEALVGAYRKNIEAITEASHLATEGMQAVARRQVEIMRDSMQDYAKMMREVTTATSAEDATARQAALAKHSFESTLAQMRELGEMIAKSSNQSIDVLNKRVSEMMEEVKRLSAKKAKPAK
jgi:phasin family protein